MGKTILANILFVVVLMGCGVEEDGHVRSPFFSDTTTQSNISMQINSADDVSSITVQVENTASTNIHLDINRSGNTKYLGRDSNPAPYVEPNSGSDRDGSQTLIGKRVGLHL